MSLNAQSLTIQTPNGGETWTYGQTAVVTWTGSGLGSEITLDYSSNGGISWSYFGNAPSGPNGGSCLVSVPNLPTENALMRVSDATDPSVSDESDETFTLYVPPIAIFVPYSGSVAYNGTSLYTNWELTFSGISLLNAEISTDNGITFTPVAQNLVAGMYYAYLPVLVDAPSDSCIIKLSNASNPDQFGLSQPFSILPRPEYTFTFPSEGDFLNALTTYTVTITVENPYSTYCNVEYSTDGGNSWIYFYTTVILGNSGNFDWITPDVNSDQCLLRITDGYEPSVTDTSEMFSIFPFPATPICLVTVDSLTNSNVVVWEKPVSDMISDFLVYKETDEAGIYEVIDTVGYEEIAISTDSISNPAMRPYRYKIGFIDFENRLFPASDFHQTIHLTINQGVNGAWNLIWTPYIGIEYGSYKIMRNSEDGNFEQIASVSSSFNSYTDFTAPEGEVSYFVKIEHPDGCNPALRDGEFAGIYSNVASNSIVSVFEDFSSAFSVYPNPADRQLYVSFGENTGGSVRMNIGDLTGRVVYSEDISDVLPGQAMVINTSSFREGMYILTITNEGGNNTRKVVIRH